MLFRLLLLLMVLCTTLLAQTPVPTSFSFPVQATFTMEHHNFDMVANELGIHIVYDSSQSIVHSLIGVNGHLLRRSVVVSNISGLVRPAISSHVRNWMEELYVAFRNGNDIQLRRSTDGGITWITPQNSSRFSETYSQTNRLQIAAEGDFIHVTWDTDLDQEVLYSRYNLLQNSWDEFFNITDESKQFGDSVVVMHGSLPDIAISEINGTKRVHVVYINERKIINPGNYDTTCTYWADDSLLFQQIIERAAVISSSSNSWMPNDILQKVTENPCPPPEANLHGSGRTTFPIITTARDSIWIVHSSKNYNWTQGVKKWVNYNSADGKQVDFYYFTKPDNRTRYSNSSGLLYTEHHSCVDNQKDGVIQWVRRFTDGNLYVTTIYKDKPNEDDINLGYGTYPKASNNSFCAILVLFSNETLCGYRIPMDISDDIYMPSNFSSKSRIKNDSSIFLHSNISASIYDTLILDIGSSLTLLPGSKITVKDGGVLYLLDSSRIILSNATLEFEGTGKAIVYDTLAIKGSGTIINPNFEFHKNFEIDENSSITFSGGGTLEFVNPSNMIVKGQAVFAGANMKFSGNLDTIFVEGNGTFKAEPGTSLYGLPSIQVYHSAYINSTGTGASPCTWSFRDTLSHFDVYSVFIAHNTVFRGDSTSPTAISEWGGVLVAYSNASISLDSCVIQNVYASPFNSGSAVHLYGASFMGNNIQNSAILRYPVPNRPGGDPKHGDGVFLQPGPDMSYLYLANSKIENHWWTGALNAGSDYHLHGNTIEYNNQGAGLNTSGYGLLLYNCIREHVYNGLYSDDAQIQVSELTLPGRNEIFNNIQRQIDVHNLGYVWGGDPTPGVQNGENTVSATDSTVTRVRAIDMALVEMPKTWWGVTPAAGCTGQYGTLSSAQENMLFDVANGGTVFHDSALCFQLASVCGTQGTRWGVQTGDDIEDKNGLPEATNGSSSWNLRKGTSSLRTLQQGLRQVNRSIRGNNFSGAYKTLGNIIKQTNDSYIAAFTAKRAFYMERAHVFRYRDSLQTSFSRLVSFLQSHYNTATRQGKKAALLRVLGHAYFFGGDLNTAEQKAKQLWTQYPSSPHAAEILPLQQFIAMARRDTVEVDSVISRMEQYGFDQEQMRSARSMRRAFLRVKPKEAVSKTSWLTQGRTAQSRDEPTAQELLERIFIRNYPNPFASSTILEYYLPEETHAQLKVFSPLGLELSTLVDERQGSGIHRVTVNSDMFPVLNSGMIFYLLTTEYGGRSGKMLIRR